MSTTGRKWPFCLKVSRRGIATTARYELGFEAYSWVYMPDGVIWLAANKAESAKLTHVIPVRTFARSPISGDT